MRLLLLEVGEEDQANLRAPRLQALGQLNAQTTRTQHRKRAKTRDRGILKGHLLAATICLQQKTSAKTEASGKPYRQTHAIADRQCAATRIFAIPARVCAEPNMFRLF